MLTQTESAVFVPVPVAKTEPESEVLALVSELQAEQVVAVQLEPVPQLTSSVRLAVGLAALFEQGALSQQVRSAPELFVLALFVSVLPEVQLLEVQLLEAALLALVLGG